LLETESPTAALVDIRLPGMDGNDFIRKACLLRPRMVFVICTGSPEYLVPPDLSGLSRVSSQLFKKPVTGLGDLENEILGLMEKAAQGGNER